MHYSRLPLSVCTFSVGQLIVWCHATGIIVFLSNLGTDLHGSAVGIPVLYPWGSGPKCVTEPDHFDWHFPWFSQPLLETARRVYWNKIMLRHNLCALCSVTAINFRLYTNLYTATAYLSTCHLQDCTFVTSVAKCSLYMRVDVFLNYFLMYLFVTLMASRFNRYSLEYLMLYWLWTLIFNISVTVNRTQVVPRYFYIK